MHNETLSRGRGLLTRTILASKPQTGWRDTCSISHEKGGPVKTNSHHQDQQWLIDLS